MRGFFLFWLDVGGLVMGKSDRERRGGIFRRAKPKTGGDGVSTRPIVLGFIIYGWLRGRASGPGQRSRSIPETIGTGGIGAGQADLFIDRGQCWNPCWPFSLICYCCVL